MSAVWGTVLGLTVLVALGRPMSRRIGPLPRVRIRDWLRGALAVLGWWIIVGVVVGVLRPDRSAFVDGIVVAVSAAPVVFLPDVVSLLRRRGDESALSDGASRETVTECRLDGRPQSSAAETEAQSADAPMAAEDDARSGTPRSDDRR
ncbi:hypothetical protein GCM10009551_084610 [Nocardiopsis tropica]|nr:hypothetical protein TTY48_32270 [Tsukamurella sp. TY48]